MEWNKRIQQALCYPQSLDSTFPYRFRSWNFEENREIHNALISDNDELTYASRADKNFESEVCSYFN